MDTPNTATANKYQALQGVTTKTNGQQYTTPPAAGSRFPETMEKFTRNMTDKNILDFEATEGNKGWVRVYRASYDPNPRETVQRLKHVIPRLVDAPTLMISPPTAAEELRERLPAPWHFLISSIPEKSLKILTDQTVWSTPTITFMVFQYAPALPRYIMTLKNLLIFDYEEGVKFVRDTVIALIKSLPKAIDFLVNHSSPED
ncbi:hypothetical protein FB45DRAFT_970138, partial [Roridomyces roridus]